VRKQIAPDLAAWAKAGVGGVAESFTWELRTPSAAIERVAEFGIYAGDPIVRRSPPLQKTADGKAQRAARMSAATMSRLGVKAGDSVRVRQGAGEGDPSRGARRGARGQHRAHRARRAGDFGAGRGRHRHRAAAGDGGRMNYWDQFMTSAQGYSTQWLGNEWGPPAFSVARALIMIVMVLAPVILTVLYYQLIERWVIGWIQVRKGPNRVGYKGILQPIADAIKLLLKEQIVPAGASKALFFLAPVVSVGPALAAWAIVPFTPDWVIADIDAAILLMLAMTSMGIYGVIIAGWASNSKYAFLGAMRATAQMVSYELAMGFALVGGLMAGQSMNLTEIVARPGRQLGLPRVVLDPALPALPHPLHRRASRRPTATRSTWPRAKARSSRASTSSTRE
jgi:hypothetical protein